MRFDDYLQYVKTMAAGGFVFHLFITEMLDMFGGIWFPVLRDISRHPWPIAMPIFVAGVVFGWWLQYRENKANPWQREEDEEEAEEPFVGPEEDCATNGY
jgi:hypothetical protein